MEHRTIAIVGGGFSGTLLALHLLRQPAAPSVVLLEKDHGPGRGVAYSTPNLSHRLNVPAGRMSAFPDEPDDFLRWLDAKGHGSKPGDFVPRWVFGCYVGERLEEAVRCGPGRLDVVRAEVEAITMTPDGGQLQCADARCISADRIVLATGNDQPQRLPMADDAFVASPYHRGNPWAPDALAGLDAGATVLLVGTGLTMVDMVISLLDAGHHGPIHAVSRRGLLPKAHLADPDTPCDLPDECPAITSRSLRRLRQEAGARGVPWRAVMDALRCRVQEVWCAASEVERRRFLRHARPWWDVHRHRIAPDVASRIDQACERGQLRIAAGRIATLVAGPCDAEIVYTPRGGSEPVHVRAARVINCTGPASDPSRSGIPLFQSLLAQDLVRPDALRLGVDVTRLGEAVRSDRSITPNLYALGPITRGIWWEITAVPDIRCHCASLARHIA